jgi:S1-C subfamily serine protease
MDKTIRAGQVLACADPSMRQVYAILLCLAVMSLAAHSQEKDRKAPLAPEARERVRNAVEAVGLISVRDPADGQLRPRGSAVVVRQDGIVVTNYHVVTQEKPERFYENLWLTLANQRYRLEMVKSDPAHDLVLMRMTGDAAAMAAVKSIELANGSKLELLDDLVIIGFPEKGGTSPTLSPGVVEGIDTIDGWIKTDARLIHGNSGGAAVNAEGKLVGVSTKVEVDRVPLDKAGTGVPLGAIGFLRSAQFVASMLADVPPGEQPRASVESTAPTRAVSVPAAPAASGPVFVTGVVRSAADGKPIAGARVGLLPTGQELAASNLITWGGTNADGQFKLEKRVQPGRYSLRAKVIGDNSFNSYSADVEIRADGQPLVIELRPTRGQ